MVFPPSEGGQVPAGLGRQAGTRPGTRSKPLGPSSELKGLLKVNGPDELWQKQLLEKPPSHMPGPGGGGEGADPTYLGAPKAALQSLWPTPVLQGRAGDFTFPPTSRPGAPCELTVQRPEGALTRPSPAVGLPFAGEVG